MKTKAQFGQNRRILEGKAKASDVECGVISHGSTVWMITYVTNNRSWFIKGVCGWSLRDEIRDFIEEQPGCLTVCSSDLGRVSVKVPRYCEKEEAEKLVGAAFKAAFAEFRGD